MYIVNTTFAVAHEVHAQWLAIIKDKYLPFVKNGGFNVLAFTRMVSERPTEGFTYSLQIEVDDMEGYGRIKEQIFPEYVNISGPIFGDRVVWFMSLLKKLEF